MIRILKQIFRTGIVTEKLPPILDPEIEKIGVKLEERPSDAVFKEASRSARWMPAPATAANSRSMRSITRSTTASASVFTLPHLRGSPTCCWSPDRSRTIWRSRSGGPIMPHRRRSWWSPWEIADATGGIFGESYASLGGIDKVIPVDAVIPGCPPTPTALLQGILKAISG